jgi:sensor domain CHASE-containing protein
MSNSYIYEVEQLQAKSRLRDEQKDAEIERLQQNLYIAQEQEKEQGQIENELRTEIERLRGLLYEVWDTAPYLGPDINKRVREALGDER